MPPGEKKEYLVSRRRGAGRESTRLAEVPGTSVMGTGLLAVIRAYRREMRRRG